MTREDDLAEHRRDLGLDEEICAECSGPMEKSWIDGTMECSHCSGIKWTAELERDVRHSERENAPRKRR